MDPQQLSRELREGNSADLTNRRWIIGLSMVGASMGMIVSLYQTGILDKLPDPPLPFFDSDRVDSANYAYSRLNAPDGPMMVANYAITAWLAATGGMNRAKNSPLLPIAMGVKAVIDSIAALKLATEEWGENRALCAYCQVATLCSLASVAFALPKVLEASGQLLSDNKAISKH
jgi:hypothetical protein